MHFARTSTRSVAAGCVVAALALVLQGSALTAGASPAEGGQTSRALTFDVLFSPFDYTDLGQPGPSSADVIVFHDTLKQAGRASGTTWAAARWWEPTGWAAVPASYASGYVGRSRSRS